MSEALSVGWFLVQLPFLLVWMGLRKIGAVPATCWFEGHEWKWVYDDECYRIYRAGNCQRCGEVGDGLIPAEPDYVGKEDSQCVRKIGFEWEFMDG
jgi:hypothetical protein